MRIHVPKAKHMQILEVLKKAAHEIKQGSLTTMKNTEKSKGFAEINQ